MCSIGTTLTLPGIAGIVLTIGMAVDANVLIFERIREESAKGKSLRGAVAAGYDRAFGTIFDSNLTTLISSVILIFMGTGPVKGFGVTLTIGIMRQHVHRAGRHPADLRLPAGPRLAQVPADACISSGPSKLDFMKLAKPAFAAVLAPDRRRHRLRLRIAARTSSAWSFSGATPPSSPLNRSRVKAAVRESPRPNAGIKDPRIQFQKDLTTGRETLRVDCRHRNGG